MLGDETSAELAGEDACATLHPLRAKHILPCWELAAAGSRSALCTMAMSGFFAVADADRVPPGRGLRVQVGDRELALFNLGGQFYALDGRCPHRGGPLGEGIIENGRVYCPLHGWEFDVKTGECINNPDKPVACFPARVLDGTVEICL